MDYKEKVIALLNSQELSNEQKEKLESIFPELKESEDERIRKALIYHYQGDGCICTNEYKIDYKDICTWLEKQGEQKPADKVEPKFKEGNWITNGNYTWKIVEVKPLDYILQSQDGNIVDDTISHVDEQFHSFTIEDAKDGDVLYFNDDTIVIFKDLYNSSTFHSYCHIEDGIFDISKDEMPDWWEGKGFQPAIKEQRDILFQKMKEAGYEWDAEKKELRKIEHNPVEWSEEDEQYLNNAINACLNEYGDISDTAIWLKSLKERVLPQPKQEWNKEDEDIINTIINHFEIDLECTENDDIIRWLKSRNPQSRWKPSKEQLYWLKQVIPNIHNAVSNEMEVLSDLYIKLKTL